MSDNIEHRAFFHPSEVIVTLNRIRSGESSIRIFGWSRSIADVPRPIIKIPMRRLIVDSEGKTWTFEKIFTTRGWKQHYLPCELCEPLVFHNNKLRINNNQH